MKKLMTAFTLVILIASCSFNGEVAQDSATASKALIENLKNNNYTAIYDDCSIEMKSFITEDVFVNMLNLQGKMNGKIVEAELQNETYGTFKSSGTDIYQYILKNEEGESFDLTAEFLKGHLLKNHIEEKQWRKESDFVKGMVSPISKAVFEENSQEIYELLGEKYPLNQVQPLVENIANTCDSVPSRYEYNWSDSDVDGNLLIAFVYAYEGKGYVEYRFYVEENEYPFAGLFFTPDAEAKLP